MSEKKKYEELGFDNNFVFCKVLTWQPELTKELLEVILPDLDIERITLIQAENVIAQTPDSKGVRLDVYTKDQKGRVYDVEMQVVGRKDLAKRSRYYQGQIDMQLLERGGTYARLNKTFVIFICKEDPFKENLPLYTFEGMCKEKPSLTIGDEAIRIFLNAKAKKNASTPKLKALLDYIDTGVASDDFTQRLQLAVKYVRSNAAWRKEFMDYEMELRISKEEGKAEGKIEGIAQGKAEGKIEGIAQGKAEGKIEGIAQGKAEGKIEGIAQGKAEGENLRLVKDIRNLMDSLNLSPDQAMAALKVPEEQRSSYREMIKNEKPADQEEVASPKA